MKKILILTAMSLLLACGPVAQTPDDPTRGRPIDPVIVRSALSEAQRLMEAKGVPAFPKTWRTDILPVRLIREIHRGDTPETCTASGDGPFRLWAAYYTHRRIGKRGRLLFTEDIAVYVMPEEDCLIHELLVHEFIHFIHERACFMGNHCGADPEAVVAHFMPNREDFPSCPATF